MPVLLDPPLKTSGSGDPEVALPGSGMAIPTSILTTFYDINGLIINNRNDVDHFWVKSMDGLYDAEVRDNREVNPDRDGETYYGGLYSGKPIVIEGVVRAQTYEKMLDMCNALTRAFDSLDGEYPIIGRTGVFERDWQFFAAKTGSIGLKDIQESYYFERPFNIPLRCSKPRIFSYQLKTASLQLSAGDNLDVVNLGNKPVEDLRILLFGAQTDISIANNGTNQEFVLNGTIPDADYFEIDFGEGTIYDSVGNNRFDQYDHTSDWLQLAPEMQQTLTVTSTGRDTAAAITVYWRDTYK